MHNHNINNIFDPNTKKLLQIISKSYFHKTMTANQYMQLLPDKNTFTQMELHVI